MSGKSDFRTPYARVHNHGSAKDGVAHFWRQRLSAVALVFLTLFAIWPLADAIGRPRAEVLEIYGNPWNAIIMVLFITMAFQHLHQGLQVIIEDYVHQKAVRTAALIGNIFFCALFALMGVFGVAKIAFMG